MKNLHNIQFEGLNLDELLVMEHTVEEMKMNCYTEIELIEIDEIFGEKESFLDKAFRKIDMALALAIEAASIKEEDMYYA